MSRIDGPRWSPPGFCTGWKNSTTALPPERSTATRSGLRYRYAGSPLIVPDGGDPPVDDPSDVRPSYDSIPCKSRSLLLASTASRWPQSSPHSIVTLLGLGEAA